jgi:hypothetical protein
LRKDTTAARSLLNHAISVPCEQGCDSKEALLYMASTDAAVGEEALLGEIPANVRWEHLPLLKVPKRCRFAAAELAQPVRYIDTVESLMSVLLSRDFNEATAAMTGRTFLIAVCKYLRLTKVDAPLQDQRIELLGKMVQLVNDYQEHWYDHLEEVVDAKGKLHFTGLLRNLAPKLRRNDTPKTQKIADQVGYGFGLSVFVSAMQDKDSRHAMALLQHWYDLEQLMILGLQDDMNNMRDLSEQYMKEEWAGLNMRANHPREQDRYGAIKLNDKSGKAVSGLKAGMPVIMMNGEKTDANKSKKAGPPFGFAEKPDPEKIDTLGVWDFTPETEPDRNMCRFLNKDPTVLPQMPTVVIGVPDGQGKRRKVLVPAEFMIHPAIVKLMDSRRVLSTVSLAMMKPASAMRYPVAQYVLLMGLVPESAFGDNGDAFETDDLLDNPEALALMNEAREQALVAGGSSHALPAPETRKALPAPSVAKEEEEAEAETEAQDEGEDENENGPASMTEEARAEIEAALQEEKEQEMLKRAQAEQQARIRAAKRRQEQDQEREEEVVEETRSPAKKTKKPKTQPKAAPVRKSKALSADTVNSEDELE